MRISSLQEAQLEAFVVMDESEQEQNKFQSSVTHAKANHCPAQKQRSW